MRAQTTLYLLMTVLVCGLFIWFLDRTAETTPDGDRVLPGLRWEQVQELVVERADWTVRCTRREGAWHMVAPINTAVDGAVIERLLMTLEELPVDEVITLEDMRLRDLSPADYALASPRARIVVRSAERDWVLRLGADKPTADGVYVARADADTVYATSSNLVAALPDTLEDIRDHRIFRGNPERITRVDLERSGHSFVRLARDHARWRLEQPVQARADNEAVASLIQSLHRIEALRFVWDRLARTDTGDGAAATGSGPVDAYGLEPSDAVLVASLWAQGDATPLVLLVGKETGEDGARYARVPGVESIFTVDAAAVDALRTQPVAALRDPRVLELSPARVRAVQVIEGEQKLTLERVDGGWSLTEPVQWPADAALVDRLVARAAALQVHAFRDAAGSATSPTGVESARVILRFEQTSRNGAGTTTNTLWLGDETAGGTLRHADTDDGATAVTIREEALVGLWPEAVAARLRRRTDPLAYRDRVVLGIDPTAVRSVTQVEGSVTSSVRRAEGDVWSVAAPADGTLRTNRIDDLLIAIASLRTERIEVHRPDSLGPFGIDESRPAHLTIGLRGTDGIQKNLLLGGAAPGGGRYAMVQGQDFVFVLDQPTLDTLLQPIVAPPPVARAPEAQGS